MREPAGIVYGYAQQMDYYQLSGRPPAPPTQYPPAINGYDEYGGGAQRQPAAKQQAPDSHYCCATVPPCASMPCTGTWSWHNSNYGVLLPGCDGAPPPSARLRAAPTRCGFEPEPTLELLLAAVLEILATPEALIGRPSFTLHLPPVQYHGAPVRLPGLLACKGVVAALVMRGVIAPPLIGREAAADDDDDEPCSGGGVNQGAGGDDRGAESGSDSEGGWRIVVLAAPLRELKWALTEALMAGSTRAHAGDAHPHAYNFASALHPPANDASRKRRWPMAGDSELVAGDASRKRRWPMAGDSELVAGDASRKRRWPMAGDSELVAGDAARVSRGAAASKLARSGGWPPAARNAFVVPIACSGYTPPVPTHPQAGLASMGAEQFGHCAGCPGRARANPPSLVAKASAIPPAGGELGGASTLPFGAEHVGTGQLGIRMAAQRAPIIGVPFASAPHVGRANGWTARTPAAADPLFAHALSAPLVFAIAKPLEAGCTFACGRAVVAPCRIALPPRRAASLASSPSAVLRPPAAIASTAPPATTSGRTRERQPGRVTTAVEKLAQPTKD